MSSDGAVGLVVLLHLLGHPQVERIVRRKVTVIWERTAGSAAFSSVFTDRAGERIDPEDPGHGEVTSRVRP
jgi:hypothetical protein